jgi:hypothetical protein
MQLRTWQRVFVWAVFLPGLLLTLLYLGFVAWPAIAFMVICLLLARPGRGKGKPQPA